MKVAIQGISGSFHDAAAHKLLDDTSIELVPFQTFSQVFNAVRSTDAEAGLVAIENSLHGSINAVYRELAKTKLWVDGEVYLKIEQFLIGCQGSKITDINEVLSQAPALAQCEQWLDKNLPNAIREETHDTADSVKFVASKGHKNKAAIGGKKAAEIYGGNILAGPINDDKHNYTRFVLLKKKPTAEVKCNKTSIILKTSHQPGALYGALGVFANANVNLSKLDSHPIPGDKWHYVFYIDFDRSVNDPITTTIFEHLKSQDCQIQILGSYPSGALPV